MNSSAQKSTISIAGAEVSRSCHACAFFHSREEYYEVLLPFIKEGLTVGDKTLHIVETCNHEDHIDRLNKQEIPTAELLASGQFELKGWTDSYLPEGHFDQNAMLDLVTEVLNETKEKGYSLSRLVGNMEWACIQDVPGVSDIIEYEARLNNLIADYDTVLVCCYDINKHSASVVMDVLRTHPYVILGGTMHENPYFVSPAQLIAELEARGSTRSEVRFA